MNRAAEIPPRPPAPPVLRRKCSCSAGHEACEDCKRKRALRRQSEPGAAAPAYAPPIVHDVLRSSGRPLESATRAHMEGRLGRDFSSVRVHADAQAAHSARAVGALAYAVGDHVVFGAGGYAPGTAAGARLLAHELAHVAQSPGPAPASGDIPVGSAHDAFEAAADRAAESAAPALASAPRALRRQPMTVSRAVCETTQNPPADDRDACSYARPEMCAAYEDWIATFLRLQRFRARSRPGAVPDPAPTGDPASREFDVIGAPAARSTTGYSPDAAPPIGTPDASERFIDHPTDQWVRQCLPANLRPTAYQLPSDCADIAIILRHVWLSAHGRQEKFGEWTIGDFGRGPATRRIGQVISQVDTGNVSAMVSPYADPNGRPLRTIEELEPLLHPGDILVWEHRDQRTLTRRTGGHTHTIASIRRDNGGRIESFTMLQGNLPIFGDENPPPRGQALAPSDDKGAIIQELGRRDTRDQRTFLGHRPGRRIEVATVQRGDLSPGTVGTGRNARPATIWGTRSVLMAAGPPRSAQRPRARGAGGTRSVTDWVPALRAANLRSIVGVAEAMLREVRAEIDAGRTVSDADARSLGEAAGRRVWALARASPGLAEEEHFRPLDSIQRMIESFGRSRAGRDSAQHSQAERDRTARLRGAMDAMRDAFRASARGVDDINFGGRRAPRGQESIRVLLTGFDPFEIDANGLQRRPQLGRWNPSGAAVLDLDGEQVGVQEGSRRAVAAIEGIVLPVSFAEFDERIVERAVRSIVPPPDAVLSVSLGGVGPGDPLRLEQLATGTRQRRDPPAVGPILRVPPEPGQADAPPILQPQAPLGQIAQETGPSDQPTLNDAITLRFADVAQANAARAALGSGAGGAGVEVTTTGNASSLLAQRATWGTGAEIRFTLGTQQFRAVLVQGPGGNFLSNEVSYRLLRMLRGGANPPLTFHSHTEAGQPVSASTRQADVRQGRAVVQRLVARLRRLVAAVGRAVLRGRHPPGGAHP